MSGTASTGHRQPGGADWSDGRLSVEWADGDRLEPLLDLPRRVTGDLLASGTRPVRTVLDVGSGPGAYLAALLEHLPAARGVWADVSDTMRRLATERLGRFGDRVDFRLLGAADIALVAEPGEVDAVVTSRMTHHLPPERLALFYRDADRLLGEWGWIANLDHVAVAEPWNSRLTAARALVVPPNPSPHRHDGPRPTLADHLDALGALGDLEVVVAWQAYTTVLILAGRGV